MSSADNTCQYSCFWSGCLRVSNQCLSLSPFELIPSCTPPETRQDSVMADHNKSSAFVVLSYQNHNQIFYLRAGTGASSTSVGPFPGNWLAALIADLTPDLLVLLSWGSTVVSFHSRQSLSVSFFHVSLGLLGPRLPSICISHAVLIAPLERSTCPNQGSLLSLKMRLRSLSSSFASYSLDLSAEMF